MIGMRFMDSQVLYAVTRLGIPDALGDRPLNAAQLAAAVGAFFVFVVIDLDVSQFCVKLFISVLKELRALNSTYVPHTCLAILHLLYKPSLLSNTSHKQLTGSSLDESFFQCRSQYGGSAALDACGARAQLLPGPVPFHRTHTASPPIFIFS